MEEQKRKPDEANEHIVEMLHKLYNQRMSVFQRFPLVFALLGTFGVVLIFYGLNHLLVKIPVISHNPVIALITGILILLFTGTLYKKLG